MTRALIAIAAALVLAGSAFFFLTSEEGVPDGAPTLDQMADSIGATLMMNVYRGHVPERSGEIMLVPKPHRFILSRWDMTTLGTAAPEPQTSHPNPWNYLAHVPLIGYGPGYFPARQDDTQVDISQIAPTYAQALGTQLDGASAPLPGFKPGTRPPKAIVTVVIDGGGWNALRQHPYSWPTIRSLAEEGSSYTRAHIGSAPSITGALHATIGAGVYPLVHGLPGNQMRGPDGANTDTWKQDADPEFLRVNTLSDLHDLEENNRAQHVTVAFEDWHLGMLGHGAMTEGGDKDVAVIWDTDAAEWTINEDFYEFPSYVADNDVDVLAGYEAALDPRDGVRDGKWFGHPTADLATAKLGPYHLRYASAGFSRLTGDVVMEVLREERVGKDAVPDVAWFELKTPDYAGHAFNVTGPEQGDVLRETDRVIERVKSYLDAEVGTGSYLLLITADHGQQPLPDGVGGWRINGKELEADIEQRFGPIIEKITPVDIYVDMEAVEREDVSLADVSRYISVYTIGENIPDGEPGANRVPEGRLGELLFAGAFPTDYLRSLDEAAIEGFGDSDYPEGEFVFQDPIPEAEESS
jgi:Type I phosphodiesterase / nucleotide pyrophosphatase